MRKISLFILILFISNCGYTPIYNSHNKTKFNIIFLSFEDLMDLFKRDKDSKDYQEIQEIYNEFERRVSKRKLMGKKPMKTSISGFEQTLEWLNTNSHLKEDEKNNDCERLCLIKSFLEYNKLLIQNNLDKLITKEMSDDFLN